MSHYLKGNVHIPETGGRTSLFLTCLTSSSSSHNYCTSKPCDSLGPTGQVCSGFWKFLTIYAHLILNRETNPIKTKFPTFLFLFPPTLSLFYLFYFLIYFYLLPFPSLASTHVWLFLLNIFFFFLSFLVVVVAI